MNYAMNDTHQELLRPTPIAEDRYGAKTDWNVWVYLSDGTVKRFQLDIADGDSLTEHGSFLMVTTMQGSMKTMFPLSLVRHVQSDVVIQCEDCASDLHYCACED
jgi:hypothetical protein